MPNRNITVRAKLQRLLLSASAAALGVSAAAIIIYEISTYQTRLLAEARSLASLYALSLPPALEFGDPEAARENLETLSAREDIAAACIYSATGKLFAVYVQPGQELICLPAGKSTVEYSESTLQILEPVTNRGDTVGYLALTFKIPRLTGRLPAYAIMVAVVILSLLVVSGFIATGFGRFVARPLSELTRTAERISNTQDYRLRAAKRSQDEFGRLTDSFNRMLDSLEQSIRLRDEFVSIASHELRTPITPLQLQVQVLVQILSKPQYADLADIQVVQKTLALSEQQLKRLTRLIDDMLDVSRVTSGKLMLRREPVDLSEVVADVVERYRGEFSQVQSMPQLRLQPAIVGQWDRFRIEQVLINLLTNAMKFGPGKPIEIVTEAADTTARVSITDHGIGIPSEDQQRIFDRFERAVSLKSFGGLGLGLYITRQIVTAHGGVIWVESTAGEGSRFIVELPLNGADQEND